MRQSESIAQLAADLAKAQGELKNAPFNAVNPHFKNKYADLAGIRDCTAPILAKHGLSIVQGTEIIDGHFLLMTRLLHKSGEWLESLYPLQVDRPQVMGSAITYGRRYCWAAMCGIAGEPDDDGEATRADNKPIIVDKVGPSDFAKEAGEMSAARSTKQWKILEPDMMAQKSPAELNKWWDTHKDTIKEMANGHMWLFFGEFIKRGADKCQHKLTLDAFWSYHEPTLNKLKKVNAVNHDSLIDYMLKRADELEPLHAG